MNNMVDKNTKMYVITCNPKNLVAGNAPQYKLVRLVNFSQAVTMLEPKNGWVA